MANCSFGNGILFATEIAEVTEEVVYGRLLINRAHLHFLGVLGDLGG